MDATMTQENNLVAQATPENTERWVYKILRTPDSGLESTKYVIESNVKETYAERFNRNVTNFLHCMYLLFLYILGYVLGSYTEKQ